MIQQRTHYIEQMIDDMQRYLMSDTLFWPIRGSNYRGTLGGILLRRAFLSMDFLQMSEEQRHHWDNLNDMLSTLLKTNAALAEIKMLRELTARHDMWATYVSLGVEAHPHFLDEIAAQARSRTCAQLVREYLVDLQDSITMDFQRLDLIFMSNSRSSHFLWNDQYQDHFPAINFPWLYREPILKSPDPYRQTLREGSDS
ncbi:MAG: hypothetical protein GYB68_03515 [Chloroflexi bacterium]|nr:hypothetical protein [Chloroflexota bacterium]